MLTLDEEIKQHASETKFLEEINLKNKQAPVNSQLTIDLRKKICDLRKYLQDNPMPPPMVDNEWSRSGYRNSCIKLRGLEIELSRVLTISMLK
jgi:hypothetical protein